MKKINNWLEDIAWRIDNYDGPEWIANLMMFAFYVVCSLTGLGVGMLVAHTIHKLGKGHLDWMIHGGLYYTIFVAGK